MDGTGKTTHALQTINYLQKAGYKCKYVWFGSPYLLSYPFMVICRLLGYTKTHRLGNGLVISEHLYYKNKVISRVWSWVRFLDIFISVNVRVKLPLLFGFTVVCDRFVPDSLVELMTDIGDTKLLGTTVGKLISELIPKSSKSVLLDVEEKTAWQRKTDIPALDYLTRRRSSYRTVAEDLRIPTVNAEAPFEVVQRDLMAKLTGP